MSVDGWSNLENRGRKTRKTRSLKETLALTSAIIAIIAIPIGVVGIFIYMNPKWKTEDIIQIVAKCAKINDWEKLPENALADGWGQKLLYTRTGNNKSVQYEVISSGRDKIFGTKDDMVCVAVDLNKSRIVGEWLGEKSKEAIKGVKEGWIKENKFESF